MPIYEYHCAVCQRAFEALVRRTDEAVTCPACGGMEIERTMSVFSARGSQRVRASSGKNCSGCASGACASCSH